MARLLQLLTEEFLMQPGKINLTAVGIFAEQVLFQQPKKKD